jgi:hypothetical protein
MHSTAEQVRTIRVDRHMDGQRMSLADFAYAEVEPGFTCELERGVIVVDVPRLTHELVVQNIRSGLDRHRLAHPGAIYLVSGGAGSVLRLWGVESERHPDITVYLRGPAPGDENPWEHWMPEIVIEVVSASSVKRDYETKREEYLRGGVLEYVIFDPRNATALVLTRRGDIWDEQTLDASGSWTTRLLPGFALPLAAAFALPTQAPR